MSPSEFTQNVAAGESLHTGITLWAARASQRLLMACAVLGLAGAVILLLAAWKGWPVAGFLVTLSTIASWGLLEQRTRLRRARWIALLQWLLVGVGALAAMASGLGLFFWMMGPAPIL